VNLADLVETKHALGYTISVCLPARNEAETIAGIVGEVRERLVDSCSRAGGGLVDEIVVIDDGSTDATAEVARAAGAAVVSESELLPEAGPGSGKGNALWKSLYACRGDLLCWLDADLRNFDADTVTRLVEPLLAGSGTVLGTLLGLYRTGATQDGFEAGIQLALEGLLVSPNFLMRIERDPSNAVAGAAYRISDLELASRLSFFLWSSIPDDELLEAAGRGTLKNPTVLEQQVRRMLRDPRSAALVSNFFGQWLYLRNLRTVTPDPRIFPDFDENLREAFQRETELFLESQLREDRNADNQCDQADGDQNLDLC